MNVALSDDGTSALVSGDPQRPDKQRVSGPRNMEKNAIMRLNELPCHVKYKFQQPDNGSPPSGGVCFRCVVEIGDCAFEDKGGSKKEAKLKAAVMAVTTLQTTGLLALLEHQQAALKSAKRKQRTQSLAGIPTSPDADKRFRTNPPQPKNAVMKLNDHHRALQYDVLSYGERDTPATVKVTVSGKEYIGSGVTKRIAKQEAAEQALRGLGLWTAEDDQTKMTLAQLDETTTAGNPGSDSSKTSFPNSSSIPSDEVTTPTVLNVTSGPPDDPSGKTPVMLLHELYRDQIEFNVGAPTGQAPNVAFDCALVLAGRTFSGSGGSKKAAKQAAAAAAVNALRMSGELDVREREMLAVRAQKRLNAPDRPQRKQFQQDVPTMSSSSGARTGKQPPLPKNSIMRLNDKYRSLPFTVVSGSDAGGWVTMTVVVEDVTYSGQGATKKQAKLSTAEAALRGLGDWTSDDENVKRMLAAAEASKPPPSSTFGRGRGRGGRGGRGGGSLRGAAVASAGRWVRGGVVNYTGGNWTTGGKDSGTGNGYGGGYGKDYQGNGDAQAQQADTGSGSYGFSGYGFGGTSGGNKSPRGRGQAGGLSGGLSGGQFGKGSLLSHATTGYGGTSATDGNSYDYGQMAADGAYTAGAYQSGYGQGSYEGSTGAYGAGNQW